MLARLYHAHHDPHQEDLPFWLELAHLQGDPILELGCGSGRVMLPLARAGHFVLGLESDPDMLTVLQENLPPGLAERVGTIQADMAAFELGRLFALILLPCNAFSTLTAKARGATLDCVQRHLTPQGLFAVSLPNPTMLRKLPGRSQPEVEEHFPHPLDGEPVQVSSSWNRTAGHFVVRWDYDHLLPDGNVERFSMQVRHELGSTEAYIAEIEAAGLHRVEIYGDYDRSPYSPESRYLIVTARRM
ncbi:MAG: hypothetical protein A2Z16_04130 [Chloroflexi bacterium RBG_16_54_18]|nr:MAG: hypothetical protein A2Z16_04130 [Chloroflexi bacterium RBG_16_54_18]